MRMLSEDDLDLAEMSDGELAAAWDLWFDLAQATNDDDPPWTHGVFVGVILPRSSGGGEPERGRPAGLGARPGEGRPRPAYRPINRG